MKRREVSHALLLALAAFFSAPKEGIPKSASFPGGDASRRSPAVNGSPITVETLMEEPLAPMPDAEVSVITLTVPPGASSLSHRHIGPVFAYILEGSIENQVDPNPPRTYHPGQFFYEPRMHVHRMLRNVSKSRPAKLLIFQVGEKGKKFTIGAN